MGLFDMIFSKKQQGVPPHTAFQLFNGYSPVFTNPPESVYEMALIRAAIHTFATFASKLKPELSGSAKRHLETTLQFKPNPVMDASKYLYRLATIYQVNNTAFIAPLEDESGTLVGYYPILPQNAQVIDVHGVPYMLYRFGNGKEAAIEFNRVGILTKFQYDSDLFGANNAALWPTMQLMTTQNQGIVNSIKNGATIRFLAKISNVLKDKDIKELRDMFTADNMSSDNSSGLFMYDTRISELKQVESKPLIVNAPQMAHINESVFNYYRTNAKIITNSFTEEEWNAYYEGEIEPWAIQVSLVHTNMTYTQREIAHDNAITFSANRLQYASNATKLNIVKELFDRGMLSLNGAMDIFNMPHVPDGDKRYIRGEYYEVDKLHLKNEKGGAGNADSERQGVPGDDTTAADKPGAETL